jgi:hypothetical protein
MAFTHSFKVLMWHSWEQSLYLLFVLGLAFGFSFLEDLFRATHRPPLLVLGAHYGSSVALIIDLAAWGLLLVISLYKLFTRPLTDEDETKIPI